MIENLSHKQPLNVAIFPSTTLDAHSVSWVLSQLPGHVRLISVSNHSVSRAEPYGQGLFTTNYELPDVRSSDFAAAFVDFVKDAKLDAIFLTQVSCSEVVRRIVASAGLRLTTVAWPRPRLQLDSTWLERVFHQLNFLGLQPAEHSEIADVSGLLLDIVSTIPGQTHASEIIVLAAAMKAAPEYGDVLEVGSFWGRSALGLSLAGALEGSPAILSVDTWSGIAAWQRDANSDLNRAVAELDFELGLASIARLAALLGSTRLNYIRSDSLIPLRDIKVALEAGRNWFDVETRGVGVTRFQIPFRMVFLDGNHDYEHQTDELSLVSRVIAPQGLVVVDDFNWIESTSVSQAVQTACGDRRNHLEHVGTVGRMAVLRSTRE